MIGDFPPHVQEFLQDQQAQLGRLPPTHHFVTRIVTVAQGNITPSESIVVKWTEDGIVLWMAGQDRIDPMGLTANFKNTMVRIQCGGDGQEDLFMDGPLGLPGQPLPNYVSLLALCGQVPSWFPLVRRVHAGVDWIVNYINIATLAELPIEPQLIFGFISDADLSVLASQPPRTGSKARPTPDEKSILLPDRQGRVRTVELPRHRR